MPKGVWTKEVTRTYISNETPRGLLLEKLGYSWPWLEPGVTEMSCNLRIDLMDVFSLEIHTHCQKKQLERS